MTRPTSARQLQPLDIDSWDDSLGRIISDMAGQPLNIHKLLANHPALTEAWWSFRQYIVCGSSLSKRSAELVILRTAIHFDSWYEWASHVVRALACNLTMEEIERVIDGPAADEWTEADALILQAVDELEARRAISPETLSRLGEYFDSRQVLDLIAIHGTYAMLGGILNTWKVALDDHVRNGLPDAVTKADFQARRDQALSSDL